MKGKYIFQAVLLLCMMVLLAPAAHAQLLGVNWDTGDLYDVSTTDGSLSVIGNTGVQLLGGMEYNGTLYGVTYGDSALYSIDPLTANTTKVGDLGVGWLIEGGVSIDSGGNLWVVSSSGSGADMYTVDLGTGAGTYQGSIDRIEVNGLALRGDGVMVGVGYEGYIGASPAKLFSIDLGTFTTSDIGTLGFDIGEVSGLASMGSTGYLATGLSIGTNSLYEVDLYAGSSTLIGSFDATIRSGQGISGLALAVPEPATMLLLGFGLIGIGADRRRIK